MIKIGIIGASSMIGSQVCEQLKREQNLNLVLGDLNGENPIDITDPKSVENFFQKNQPDWAILFSAFTDVDSAENQRNDRGGICWKINVEGVKNVVNSASVHKCKLIFTSTDFIFDGENGPYKEEDPPGPNVDKVGWYGITKIEGEKYIRENMQPEDYLILRMSFPFSGKKTLKQDFAQKTINLYKEGKLYPMYSDQEMTPTFIPDIAPAILALLDAKKTGIYNLASPQLTTPYEFTKYLLSSYEKKQTDIEKGSLGEQLKNAGATPRPLNGGLLVEKITPIFKPTSWKEGIDKIDLRDHI